MTENFHFCISLAGQKQEDRGYHFCKTRPGQKPPGQRFYGFEKLHQDRIHQEREFLFQISLPGQKQQDRELTYFKISNRTEIISTQKTVFALHFQDRSSRTEIF